MATLDRNIFVPYLTDIHALYLAQQKLERLIAEKETEIVRRENIPEPDRPYCPLPDHYDYKPVYVTCAIVLGLCILFSYISIAYFSYFSTIVLFVALLAIAVAVCTAVYVFRAIKSAEQNRTHRLTLYEAEKKTFYAERGQQLSKLNGELVAMRQSLEENKKLLQKAYSANVIPGQFRNKYAAFYLFEYFAQSMENDLTPALQLFVLGEIRQKLDSIAHQQEELVLNQRRALAAQEIGEDKRREHAERMEDAVNRIAKSEEERTRYMRMVFSNSEVTDWFNHNPYI